MNTLKYLVLLAAMSGFTFSANAGQQSDDSLVIKGQQCSLISERLERLSCFDAVFQTPTASNRSTISDDKPQAWHTAFDTADGNAPLSIVENGSDKEGDAWLTLTANHAEGDSAPVLMMSCINKISRIELALPQAIEDGRIRVSIAGGPNQSWRSDDIGVLFSSARGLPAISMMKVMSRQARLTLRSNSQVVDGLQFDTTGLNQALKPLRTKCGW
ncbi:type VI secretion system-associated protein TagO [Vibrio brasiliensis]|uniref:type VI secretion system-associated protein VasI n=1 Tax=Vibrio brasiliensis TaxID=170652 RepID=UPI001EFD800C|nr:type VI secretion system-associated protein VasI [Vibrio brasiliensis]MCG9649420.1 type VI secretion system-associated protein TagO [Vibrio brasiliensis]